MLPVVLSELVLIRISFEETYFYHLYAYSLSWFYEKYLEFLTSHICFHWDNSKLWKQEMIEQEFDLETVKLQEIPINVCVVLYNTEICYRGFGEKASFLAII